MAYRLGVDLGTTFTAAAVDDGSGPTMVGLGNRALQVPSVLFLQQDGTFLFGEAAERRAAVEPDRAVREFKRRLGDTVPILVAGRPFSPQALTARLLGWVVERVAERQGSAPDGVVLTHPANWGGYKRELLDQVVTLADLPGAVTCTEPEAAASQYTARSRVSPGDRLVVYDLGGGTFDVCVLQKQEVGFRILGSPDGVEHLGGIDFDEAVFGQVLAELGDAAARLDPGDPLVTSGVARLRRECVEAKEALSNDVDAVVPVTLPGLSVSVRVTRTDFEALITPALRDTLTAVRRALRSADTSADSVAAVVLVGGSSRIPLVSHLLQDEFGGRMAMDIHPKHDIALGALRYQQGSQETAPLPASDLPRWPTRDAATGSSPVHGATTAAETPIAADAGVGAAAGAAATQQVSAADTAAMDTAPPASRPPAAGRTSSAASSPWWRGGLNRWRNAHSRRAALIVSAVVLAVLSVVAVASAVVLTGGDDDEEPTTGASDTTPAVTPSVDLEPITRSTLILPIQTGSNGVDLYLVYADGARELVHGRGDQRFPSMSRDLKILQYASRGDDDKWTQLVVRDDGDPEEMFDPPPDPLYCPGRLAWPRRAHGRVALICETGEGSTTSTPPPTETPDTEFPDPETPDSETPDTETPDIETPDTESPPTESPDTESPPTDSPPSDSPPTDSPPTGAVDSNPAMRVARAAFMAGGALAEQPVAPPTQAVYLAKVDEEGHVDGGSMTEVDGFAVRGLSDLSYTGTGGLVVSIEAGSERGIYYRPPGPSSKPIRLTSGPDSDSMGSPKKGDDRVVFTRDGDLYLVAADGGTPECAVEIVVDDETGASLCQLTSGDDEFDEGPAWSWDGESIAFIRAASEGSPPDLKRLEVADPTVVAFSDGLDGLGLDIEGEPSWASR